MALELISLKTGVDWASKLWGALWKGRERYRKDLEEINTIIYGDPMEIARCYVEPDCQEMNPVDRPEDDPLVAKEPVMRKVDQFFDYSSRHDGDNQLFVLSDAGMGKTALLTMLKLMHLTAFWPNRTDCVLKKLGPSTLSEIGEIPNKSETILLLDSLDEDPEAYGKVQDRLLEILKATQPFKKVVITCRTQFFPKVDEDPFKRPGLVTIGGFTCFAKYLSFFSDEKVTQYLEKRFPRKYWLWTDKKKMAEAREVIGLMGSLRCRPMLLSYIEDLMASPVIKEGDREYAIYDALVRSWLIREKNKVHIDEEELLKACIILATILHTRGKRSIGETELDSVIDKICEVMPIKKIELKGRSLINPDSEGHYRFSHFSIQEFCVAKLLLEDKVFTPRRSIPVSTLLFRWIVASGKEPNLIERLDFQGLDLAGADLHGVQLPGADLSGLNLEKADLSGANLKGANLQNANFKDANLSGAHLSVDQFTAETFEGSILDEAQFEFCIPGQTDLKMTFACIPSGTFNMGSPADEPERREDELLHRVTISNAFLMQTTQVTQRQWKTVMGNNPSHFAKGGDDCPVESVSWQDVQKFVDKLNDAEGANVYRLPTEAEWEYACRAGTDTPFSFGRCLSTDEANYDGNYPLKSCPKGEYRQRTIPVGSLAANAWGLYDMHGNVWEWCQDWYDQDYYGNSPEVDPRGPESGAPRVLRGGSWYHIARDCRSAGRPGGVPADRARIVGFRLVRSLP